jgi:beta-phosphoglucomutase-like phosphatase (HAD superfamily)
MSGDVRREAQTMLLAAAGDTVPPAAPITPARGVDRLIGLFIDLAGVMIDAAPACARLPGLRGGVGSALRLLDRLDYRIVVLAPCALDRRQSAQVSRARIADLLARERITPAAWCACASTGGHCIDCPPAPAILLRAAQRHGLALHASWLLAREPRFLAAGRHAGCRTMLIGMDTEAAWLAPMPHDAANDAANAPAAYRARDIVDAALAIIRLDGER